MVPELLVTLNPVMEPAPAALMVPLLLDTVIPEIEPVETVPVFVPMLELEMVPEPVWLSSGAEMVPELLVTLNPVMDPAPAALMVPLLLDTVIPEIEPVETVPVFVPMLELEMVPEPVWLSSGAEMVPELLVTLNPVMDPAPAALMVPLLLDTVIPEIEPVETVPVFVPMLELEMVPEPV